MVSARFDESTRTRSSEAIVLLTPTMAPPLPTLSEPFRSVTVLAPTIGSRGVTDGPCSGPSSTCGSYSDALSGLKGRLTDSSSVPTQLARQRIDGRLGRAGFGRVH